MKALLLLSWVLGAGVQPLPSDSIYLVGTTFKTDLGEAAPLERLRGKPVVLAFAYTQCSSTCPLTIRKLKLIQRAANERKLELQYVVVSIDPERDTPKTLANFRKHQELDRSQWTLLTGKVADVRLLATALGFKFAKNAGDGQVMHDNKLYLLDGEGRVASSVTSVDEDALGLLAAVSR